MFRRLYRAKSFQILKVSLNFSGATAAFKVWYDGEKQMLRSSPCQTNCQPTACRRSKKHARCTNAPCAEKEKKLQKTLATAGLVLLALALAAALALFAREKLQTLDKPLDAKTAQTQPVPQEPDIPAAEPDPEPEPSPNRSRTLNRRFSPSRRRSRNPNRNRNPRRRLKKTYAPADVTDETKTLDLELYSENALLIDLESNTIIAQKNADARIYPASMTKVMTVLVAAEQITDWDATFTMTQSIIDPLFLADASMAGFVHGEEVSMMDLLYGAVLPSGAEATEALAIVCAGSEEAFAELMNEKAQALGLQDTLCRRQRASRRKPLHNTLRHGNHYAGSAR